MADANRLAAALRYQQDMEGPVTMNPNIAEQGRKGRANMAPPTSVMDPRSRDYERKARETENFLIGADILTGALPFAPLAKGAVMAAGKYAGPELARGLENYMVKSGAVLPMDVWHGSPHRFPPTAKNPLGEFDPMKIGTGEGAQAYGAGAGYLAEAKGVGTEYARALGPKTAMSDPEYVAAQARLGKFEDAVSRRYKQDALSPMEDIAFYSEKYPKRVISAADKIQAAEQAAYDKAKAGYLYKVDLPDEHIAKMLDWDKPFSNQSPDVQELIKNALESRKKQTGGYGLFDSLEKSSIKDLIATIGEQRLQQAGIPGIRYLDQGSRAGGAGTSNFVVFDPAHMNILERNGVTAASLRNVAPQDEALRLAQQRAALPVEQHGLGLPADNTPQQRAAAMGFETPAYHGTASDVVGLNPSAYGSSTGAKSAKDAFWAAQSPETAIGYAHYAANSAPVRQLVEQANQYERLAQRGVNPKVNWAKYDDALRQAEEFEQSISGNRLRGQNVMPLLVNTNKANVIDAGGGAFVDLEGGVNDLIKKTKRQGKDVAVIKNLDDDAGFNNRATDHYGILNPDVLRSRFAAFDPFRRNAALAAALGVAAPDLLAEEK